MKLQRVSGLIGWLQYQDGHSLAGNTRPLAQWFERFDCLLASTALLHPYLRRTPHQSWIVRHQQRTVGIITAMLCRDGSGRFGFFNCVSDATVAHMLTDAAEQWLRSQGAKAIMGPFNPSIHESCGLLKEAKGVLPYGYPDTSSHLISCLEACGYSIAKTLYAFQQADRQGAIRFEKRMGPLLESLAKHGMKMIVPGWRTISRDAQWLECLINQCWQQNWGFEPISRAETLQMLLRILVFLPAGSLCFIGRNGQPAGLSLAVPDAREIAGQLPSWLGPLNLPGLLVQLRRGKTQTWRIALLGVTPDLQGTMLGLAASCKMLQYQIHSNAERSSRVADMGWILEDNQPMLRFLQLYGGELATTHVIMAKEL